MSFINNVINLFKKNSVENLVLEHEKISGTASKSEKDLIKNALTYKNFLVEDLMVPRSDIVAINVNSSYDNIKQKFIVCKHSRIPIFNSSLDNIIGFLHVKDMMIDKSEYIKKYSNLIKPLIFVSSKMKAIDLLAKMRKSGMHLGISIDEYGGVDGLITMQDLVESIVGNIEEEYKVVDQENDYVMLSDGTINANARVSIEHIEKEFLVKIENPFNCDTIAGVILSYLGRMPELNEEIEHDSGLKFKIISMNPRRLLRVLIEKGTTQND